jgi:hypothetical protein
LAADGCGGLPSTAGHRLFARYQNHSRSISGKTIRRLSDGKIHRITCTWHNASFPVIILGSERAAGVAILSIRKETFDYNVDRRKVKELVIRNGGDPVDNESKAAE